MAITFACPNCSKTLRADDSHAGKRARCSGCKSPVVVPSGGGDGGVYPVDELLVTGSSQWGSMPYGPPPVITISPPPVVAGDPDDDTVFGAGDRMQMLFSIPPEPWYYRFIVGYAWLVAVLGFAQFALVLPLMLIGWAMRDPLFPAAGSAVLALLEALYSLGVLLACLAVAAPMLLIVDAARNLRMMRFSGR